MSLLRSRPLAGLALLGFLAVGSLGAQAAKPPSTQGAPASKATIPERLAALLGGTSLSSQPGGSPVVSVETPLRAEVVERRNGWTHVRLELWVKDAALGDSLAPGGITGADLRAQPDRYVGQTVDWTLQSLGMAEADELRPEMPMGQTYLLARGPLPETGFVYLMVPADQVETFKALPPLTRIRRARHDPGRSVPIPCHAGSQFRAPARPSLGGAMNEHLKERILRRLETLSDERGYQVLDYVEFLESKYAERGAPTNIFAKFTERVEDTLRAGKMPLDAISGTVKVFDGASKVMQGLSSAAQTVLDEGLRTAQTITKPASPGKPATVEPAAEPPPATPSEASPPAEKPDAG